MENANHQEGLRKKATGTTFWVSVGDNTPVELRDGDQVVIMSGGQRLIWSIRQQRAIGYT